jgi:beta-glucosidase
LWSNTWWSDPIFFKQYPADGLAAAGAAAPTVRAGDFDLIAQPLDFYGANIYQGHLVRAGADRQPERVPFPDGHPLTSFYWYVTPDALYWGPRFLWERYGKPIYITENGVANPDWVAADGGVHDPQRIDFTRAYLRALRRAAAGGVDVRGYFHWSIMDNFEWGEGFRQRFGLVYVDYVTQRRVPKDSAYWYRDVIASNGATLDAE